VPRGDVFGLLAAVGAECAGAVQVLPEGRSPAESATQGPALADADVAALLQDLPRHPLGVGEGVRLSLAGVQDKLLLTRQGGRWHRPGAGQPSTHILKPQPRAFPDLVEAELFGLRFARAVGAEAASARAATFGERRVLVVERYDRVVERYDRVVRDGRVRRVHQEDFCQAGGRAPEQKYEADGGPGWRDVAGILRRVAHDPRRDLLELVRAVAITVLVGNADAHARNLSLLLGPEGHRLGPLYDVVPTLHVQQAAGSPPLDTRMAMAVNGVWEIGAVTQDDVLAEVVRWPVPRSAAERVLGEVQLRGATFTAGQEGRVARAVLDRLTVW